MAKKKKNNALDTAKELADILLYKATGGAMGTPCKVENGESNFAEMRSLLESIIKIRSLELKGGDDEEDEPSAFDIIQKEVKNGGKKAKRGSFEAASERLAEIKRAEDARNSSTDSSESE